MLPRFEMRPLAEDEGGGYLIEFPDFPGCVSDGETPEQAIEEGRDALASYCKTLEELCRPVPVTGDANGGHWQHQVSKSLHVALVVRADREGVSLNKLLTAMLDEKTDPRQAFSFKRELRAPPGIPGKTRLAYDRHLRRRIRKMAARP